MTDKLLILFLLLFYTPAQAQVCTVISSFILGGDGVGVCNSPVGVNTEVNNDIGISGAGYGYTHFVTTGNCTNTSAQICAWTDDLNSEGLNFTLHATTGGNTVSTLLWSSYADGGEMPTQVGVQTANRQWVCDTIPYSFAANTTYGIGVVYTAGELNISSTTGGTTFHTVHTNQTTLDGSYTTAATWVPVLYLFFTDGTLQDVDVNPILDALGDYIYDGY